MIGNFLGDCVFIGAGLGFIGIGLMILTGAFWFILKFVRYFRGYND